MTAEVAVMNKSAVAIAADSAVTTELINSSGKLQDKIFNTANKVFSLSKYAPVGVMIYNATELSGVPWETLIKEYRRYLETKRFDYLEEYANSFFRFLVDRNSPFNEGLLRDVFYSILARTFYSLDYDEIESKEKGLEILDKQIEELEKLEYTESFEEGQLQLPPDYLVEIDEIAETVFKFSITNSLKSRCRKLATLLITKDHQLHDISSGVVITGFGQRDIFPKLVEYKTDLLLLGKVKKIKLSEYSPNHFSSGKVMTFAQKEITRTILEGINPKFAQMILNSISQVFNKLPQDIIDGIDELDPSQKRSYKTKAIKASNVSMDKFLKQMVNECINNHVSQIEEAIQSMPISELAEVAELLIKLTQVRHRLSPESETVGGPIDVAVISKADGFVWIKRKFYFKKELNYSFTGNYLNKGN